MNLPGFLQGRGTAPVEEAERIGTWADDGYRATDEEAHRDVRYDGCSSLMRVYGVFRAQMKLFSKNRWMYIMVFMAVLIPVIMLIMPGDWKDAFLSLSAGSTQYIGFLLCLLPLMVSFFTSVLCGTQIPNEFKERTAYMSMPMPVTRTEFFAGKYLAGFVLCLGVFLMAFGFSILTSMMEYDAFFSDVIAEALAVTIVMIFAYSATAYCVGCFMDRGSALVPAALQFIIIPAILLYVAEEFDIGSLLLMPWFMPDMVLSMLGSPLIVSPGGIVGISADPTQMVTMMAIGVVWGLVMLAIGNWKFDRREMRWGGACSQRSSRPSRSSWCRPSPSTRAPRTRSPAGCRTPTSSRRS